MQEEKYLIIPNSKDLKPYQEYGFNSFILPLDNYSIGFDKYYSVEEINELSSKLNIYVIINKMLHRSIETFKTIYDLFNSNIKFIIEDIALLDVIDKSKVVLYESHLLANKKAVNFLNDLNIKDVVINNDLTVNEIKEIRNSTVSKLYYFVISKNNIMYSRRNLISNFNNHYGIKSDVKTYNICERATKENLLLKEELNGTTCKYNKVFCANKYINELLLLDYLIIDFTNINDESKMIILENYNKESLVNMIDCDYYFLESEIKYKVGDLK